MCLCPIAPDTYYSYTTTDNVTFHYFPAQRPAAEAEAACRSLTAHLASYSSLAQQAEVEQHFLAAGLLLPTFSPLYWLGLASQNMSQWPLFKWAEPGLPAPTRQRNRYVQWQVQCMTMRNRDFCAEWWQRPTGTHAVSAPGVDTQDRCIMLDYCTAGLI